LMKVIRKNEEARAYIATIHEERIRRAVDFGVCLAVRVAIDEKDYFIRDAEAVPLDLLMYAKLLRALFEREDKLRAAMAGEPDEWGPA
jgi:hypothetical protein